MAKMRRYYHGMAKLSPDSGDGIDDAISDRVYTDPGLDDGDAVNAGALVYSAGCTYVIDGVFYTLAATSTAADCRGLTTVLLSTPYVAIGFLVDSGGVTTPCFVASASAVTAADLPDIDDGDLLIGYALITFAGISTTTSYAWGQTLASHGATYYDGTPTAFLTKDVS